MQQTPTACMPMPPQEPPPPELFRKQLCQQLRTRELELQEANDTVRKLSQTIRNLQLQVDWLQAQLDKNLDGKIFGNPGSGERSGSEADPAKTKPDFLSEQPFSLWGRGAKKKPEEDPCSLWSGKRSTLTRGPVWTPHGLRICHSLA